MTVKTENLLNVLSLFDGMSCGMLAFKELGLPIENYYAYEIDKYAIKTSLHNFPEIKQCGDVFEADFSQYKDIDYLIGGSPCFTQGHLVLTSKGYKDISEIEIGDMVLTHKDRFRPVVRLYKKEAETINLKIIGYPEFTTTENHPFYSIKRRKVSYSEYKNIHSWRTFSKIPEWIEAKDLTTDNFCGEIIGESRNINEYHIDKELAWILGRYVADGHLRKSKRKDRKDSYLYQVVLSIGSKKVEHFKEKVKLRNFSCYPHGDNVYRCVFNSMKLLSFISDQGFGTSAYTKCIPEFIFDLPNELRKEFLNGYIAGDGCYVESSGQYMMSTVSPKLAFGLQRLITSIYQTNVGVTISNNDKKHMIKDRKIHSNYPLYTITFKKSLKKQSIAHIQDDIMWTQVKYLKPNNKKETVYNIEVEEDNSYTVNNCIVHNCTYWSIAQSKDKRETTASGIGWELFSQYVRALHEVKPDYFIYENNKSMSKDIYKSISDTFGFEPICINSALVSAQNRQRLYWVGKRNSDNTYTKVNIEQPADRGILLRDVLDGMTDRDKGRAVIGSTGRTTEREYFKKTQGNMTFEPVKELSDGEMEYMVRETKPTFDGRWNYCQRPAQDDKAKCLVANVSKGVPYNVVAEPVNVVKNEKARCLNATYSKIEKDKRYDRVYCKNNSKQQHDYIAEPVCVQEQVYGRKISDDGKYDRRYEARIDSKSGTLTATNRQNAIAEPVNPTIDGKSQCIRATCYKDGIRNIVGNEIDKKTGIAEPVMDCKQVGALPRPNGELSTSQAFRIYDIDAKSVTLKAGGGGAGGKTGLYAIPVEFDSNGIPVKAQSYADGKIYKVYLVQDGKILIKEKEYPIKLQDRYYIIRKLTVSECKRLQTVPDWYEFPVSDTRSYAMLGNGWTIDVIVHLIKGTLE